MDDPVATVSTSDFYDKLNDNPGRMLQRLGGLLLWIIIFVSAFWWTEDAFFLLMCFIVAPILMLAIPRALRDTYLAYRGMPALRISTSGFWARQWSYLGWVNWSDVASVAIEGEKLRSLIVVLRDKEFARLSGQDQVSIMLARVFGFLFFTDVGPNRLRLIGSAQLASRWERLTTTLDPILAANQIPRSLKPIRR